MGHFINHMSLYAGVGVSQQLQDSRAAGRDAASQAIKNMNHDKPDIAVVLASSFYDQQEMLKGIQEILPGTSVVGCSTAGVLTSDGLVESAVAILAMKSDTMSFHPVKIEKISTDMKASGKNFANTISDESKGDAKLAFIFSDALSGNGTELVRGVFEILGGNFPLIGGAAGDDMNFKKTYQYYDDEVFTDAAVGFAVTGDVKYAVGADHGWQPFGVPRAVTKAKGTTLIELDGKPAFSIYEDYFGKRAADFKKALSLAAVSYPLGMKVGGSDKYMIRVPLAVNDDKSIVCGAELIEGSEISLMIGTISSALWAAKDVIENLVSLTQGAEPKVVFVSNCVARKILYGERGKEEIQLLKNAAGENAYIFGFFSYGQISPFSENPIDVNTCDPGFYEQSISIAVFGS